MSKKLTITIPDFYTEEDTIAEALKAQIRMELQRQYKDQVADEVTKQIAGLIKRDYSKQIDRSIKKVLKSSLPLQVVGQFAGKPKTMQEFVEESVVAFVGDLQARRNGPSVTKLESIIVAEVDKHLKLETLKIIKTVEKEVVTRAKEQIAETLSERMFGSTVKTMITK